MFPFARALDGLYRPEGAPVGQGLVEYALILGGVALFVLAALVFFQAEVAVAFSAVGDSLAQQGGPACPPTSRGWPCR